MTLNAFPFSLIFWIVCQMVIIGTPVHTLALRYVMFVVNYYLGLRQEVYLVKVQNSTHLNCFN